MVADPLLLKGAGEGAGDGDGDVGAGDCGGGGIIELAPLLVPRPLVNFTGPPPALPLLFQLLPLLLLVAGFGFEANEVAKTTPDGTEA